MGSQGTDVRRTNSYPMPLVFVALFTLPRLQSSCRGTSDWLDAVTVILFRIDSETATVRWKWLDTCHGNSSSHILAYIVVLSFMRNTCQLGHNSERRGRSTHCA